MLVVQETFFKNIVNKINHTILIFTLNTIYFPNFSEYNFIIFI